MSMEAIPIPVLLAATILVVLVAVEFGYRLGGGRRRQGDDEKLPPVSSIDGSTLGLLAFILAFTFGMVGSRYDARKALVRNEANAIHVVWLRSDFLPEPDRGEATGLIRTYVDRRLGAVQSRDLDKVREALAESERIQHRLWAIAVATGRRDLNSPIAALYVESVNQLIELHALRVAVGVQARIPAGIWLALYSLLSLAMIGVGYQTAIAGSTRRSWASPILALSFSLVIALIASLDRPQSTFITVSQQPLVDVQKWMGEGGGAVPATGTAPEAR
jgi:hypothetical protein